MKLTAGVLQTFPAAPFLFKRGLDKCLLAADVPFYTWEDSLERASLTTVQDGEPLAFSYSDIEGTVRECFHQFVH